MTAAASGSTSLIRVDQVAKVYAAADGVPVRAVDCVSCTIEPGEFISVLGPSGCGKSTLLMMIAGLLRPSEGQILFKGKKVVEPHADFGMVFQDAVLFPWRTVQANVELPGEVS